MIQEIVVHTKKSDIPAGYVYDTETSDFYVYRHKYTGKEIHKAKTPPLYVNVKDYIDEVLDKIRAEIDEHIEFNKRMNYMGIVGGLALAKDMIDKYKGESEG